MVQSPPTPIGQLLRQRTAEAHYRLESRLDAGSFFDARDLYMRLLLRFYGIYAPLEQCLDGRSEWDDLQLDYGPRKRLALLTADLAALGWSQAAIPQTILCPSLPPLQSAAQIGGLMYVLEGSTLGGTMISRRLRQSLGLHPGSGGGAQFFFSYGPQVGRMWRDFTAALEAYSEGNAHGKDEEIVASAQATFACMEEWLLGTYPLRSAA